MDSPAGGGQSSMAPLARPMIADWPGRARAENQPV
jgi:hypothetical protein